jgi:putative Holliday junction resolvase
MGRWLGIDHGAKRIGVAVGGMEDGIATPLEVLPAEPREAMIQRLRVLAEEYQVEGIVVGWPLNMDGTEGPQGRLARRMGRELSSATGLDVRMWDERLTSFEADQALAGLLTRQKKKRRQDAVAAAAMLRGFLSSGGPQVARVPGDVPPD